MNDDQKAHINQLLDSNGAALEGADAELFRRLQQAKAEGDEAFLGIGRLRDEITRYEVMVQNRQGRFDALAELLAESRPKDIDPPAELPEKDPEPTLPEELVEDEPTLPEEPAED